MAQEERIDYVKRREILREEIAQMERAAREYEDVAALALARGQSTEKASAEMDKAQTQLRIARAALASVERAIAEQAEREKVEQAKALQDEANRLDEQMAGELVTLYRMLGDIVVNAERADDVGSRLSNLRLVGKVRTKYTCSPVSPQHLKWMRERVEKVIIQSFDEGALRPLGLKKPPTQRELALADARRRVGEYAEKLADLKRNEEAAISRGASPTAYKRTISDAEDALGTWQKMLNDLEGTSEGAKVKAAAKRREEQLDAMERDAA